MVVHETGTVWRCSPCLAQSCLLLIGLGVEPRHCAPTEADDQLDWLGTTNVDL